MNTMSEIQKKIILRDIVGVLNNGTQTKTHLRRNLGYSENDVDDAIAFGENEDYIEVVARGYVSIKKAYKNIVEEDYYDCIEGMLNRYYHSRITNDGRYLLVKTARRDTKIAGRWTRPDFTIVANRKFPYIREPEFDIITFEVKRPEDCEALAVFEALAHNSAATRSYVFFPITAETLDGSAQGERVREECVRHGIGLFLVNDEYSLDDARIEIESQRRPLNPEKCSQFLQNVLEQKDLAKITTWP
jgi:hypothetical protein